MSEMWPVGARPEYVAARIEIAKAERELRAHDRVVFLELGQLQRANQALKARLLHAHLDGRVQMPELQRLWRVSKLELLAVAWRRV